MDSRRSSSAVDEVAKIREKHQSLLQDYLVLQKECVSKKRKLKETKEKKETLLDEIRFLKRRRNLLLKMKSQHSEQQDFIQSQKTHANSEVGPSGRYASSSKTAFQNSLLAADSVWNSASLAKEEVGFPSVKLGKKPKDMFTNGKRAEKRKISWQDQLALKV